MSNLDTLSSILYHKSIADTERNRSMEQSPTMNYEPINQKLSPAHRLISQKAGIVEFFLGIIVLLLVFVVLNYFNILPISSAFPDQLGWLPRQSPRQSISKNYTPATTPTPFQYDIAKAKILLTQYIKDTIKPEFLPAKIEVKQGLSSGNVIEDVKYEFGSSFTTRGSSISANFYYKTGTDNSNAFIIFVKLGNINQATVTASLANSLLSSYFTSPYPILDCKTKGPIIYCENFQILVDGKRGYGIFMDPTFAAPTLASCFIPKDSEYYKLESCIKI